MAYADCLTGWLEVAHFPGDASSSRVITHPRQFFTRWGAPEQLSTDGGTNLFSGEVADFLGKWGVRARMSSAHYPQSNGRAEVAVKVAKRVLRGNTGAGGSLYCDKATQALLQYRTPHCKTLTSLQHSWPLVGSFVTASQLPVSIARWTSTGNELLGTMSCAWLNPRLIFQRHRARHLGSSRH